MFVPFSVKADDYTEAQRAVLRAIQELPTVKAAIRFQTRQVESFIHSYIDPRITATVGYAAKIITDQEVRLSSFGNDIRFQDIMFQPEVRYEYGDDEFSARIQLRYEW